MSQLDVEGSGYGIGPASRAHNFGSAQLGPYFACRKTKPKPRSLSILLDPAPRALFVTVIAALMFAASAVAVANSHHYGSSESDIEV